MEAGRGPASSGGACEPVVQQPQGEEEAAGGDGGCSVFGR